MRTIIAGSRGCDQYDELVTAICLINWTPTVVISGAARGADRLGERWARANSIPVERYPARWDEYGRSAGYRRNEEMAKVADALIALWDFKSRGTEHMISLAERYGLITYIHRIKPTVKIGE